MKRTIILLFALALLCMLPVGCAKKAEDDIILPTASNAPTPSEPVTSESVTIVQDNPDGLVWIVDNTNFANYMQDDINRILQEKGRSYTVKIIAFDQFKTDYMTELKK